MKPRSLSVLALLALPVMAPAASREIQELQRDIGMLQDQVKTLQKSQDDKMMALTEKLTALQVLAQQSLDAANRANTGVAVIQNGSSQNLKDLENKVVAPVAGLSARVDQMSTDFRTLQQAVSDLTTLMGKLQAQITDLSNAVKVIPTPSAPPPGASGGGPPAAANDTPTESASQLYADAMRDRGSAKYDLALDEFAKYLRWYPDTSLAANAQYWIASIHYQQGDYENALKEFDTVLEKYPEKTNNKIPEALYYKGMSLVKLGRRTQGADEFLELLKRYPNHDLARQACSQRVSMGLKCVSSRAAAPRGSRSKR
ncbi:MAG TPA: tetratricopeptide repeat protein [Bryobacteraceae bacterium]|nr:tetratricopeptide repeat protein [Bryobacteraceae bacterium]